MFEGLSERLDRSLKVLKGQGRISEINVAETVKEIRKALLEADVSFKIAKEFTNTVKEKALGQNVLTAVSPNQLMVKIVHDELAALMGGQAAELNIKNNPQYLNFTGELTGLNHILRKGYNQFELREIELKLPNKKQVDFVFRDKETEEMLYVDFVSIHHIDIEKLSSDDGLILFLEKRFNAKLESKTKDLNKKLNKIIVDGNEYNFAILPIIWTEINTLLPFKNAFNKINEKYANIFMCCSVLPQELDNEEFIFSFCSVSNILEMWNPNK